MHRTSSKNRFLKVQRETVRLLASSELRSAQGGGTSALYSNDDGVRCYPPVEIPDIGGATTLSIDPGGQCPSPGLSPDFIFDPVPIFRSPVRGGGR